MKKKIRLHPILNSFKYNFLMQNLPIHSVLPKLKKELLSNNRLVLQAAPGAGKTTALPLSLLDEPWLEGKIIIMLEPRRLAVRSCAARMAEMLGEKVGERIGYQIKMESVQSKRTKILIVTEGILTRRIQADPALENVALLIFDEFHERSLHADLSLAFSLESQMLLREDLKILVMSATLNTSAVSALLQGAPIIQSEGRSYPVEEIHLGTKIPQPTKKELPLFIERLVLKLLQEEEGSILVFLPGAGEIRKTQKRISERLKASGIENLFVSALYGELSKEEQDRAIRAPSKGQRKIVLATNIAQTSLTIEGIRIVIDSGLQNRSLFNSSSGMNSLQTLFISEDSATQRSGRAGRLSEGKCYRLWHKGKILLKHEIPEILSADLTQTLLELALWGESEASKLKWMDTPPEHALLHARELLYGLGAIDEKAKITEHGKKISSFALHPRLAHMMIKAEEMGYAYEASLICALVSEKDIYIGYRSADLSARVSTLHDINAGLAVHGKHIDLKQCHFLLKTAKRVYAKSADRVHVEMTGVLLALAYPDRIAQRRGAKNSSYLLSNAKGAFLREEDELFGSAYLSVCDLDAGKEDASIYKAASLTQEQILSYLSDLIQTKETLSWNAELQRAEARRTSSLGSIVIKETQMPAGSNEEGSLLLIEAIRELGLELLDSDKKALALRQRVSFVNAHKALLAADPKLPDFSDGHLLETMREWLLPYLEGKNSIKSCKSLNLFSILSALLSWEQMQALEELAPSKLLVASGSNVSVDYSDADMPVLAVRLQEMFGTKETPRLLGGMFAVTIHLLSPAHRPMQITQDLESFWKTAYAEVKKELRGKYKKHYWPDDPLIAQATRSVKPSRKSN